MMEEGGESELAMEEDEEEDGGDNDEDEMDEEDVEATQQQLLDSNNLWMNGSGPDCMGCTAVVALVCKGSQEVFCANAGDSRCILVSGAKAVDLSEDHKPTLKRERLRIKKAGGFVLNPEDGGRVDGNLSLSRAFGDFAYKKNKQLTPSEQKITCEPEVLRHRLSAADNFLVLGCDGIWEKASSQNVADFVRPRVEPHKVGKHLSGACAAFLDKNLAKSPMADMGLGCDNMTLMAVDLRGRAAAKVAPATATKAVARGSRGSKRRHLSSLSIARCSRSCRRRLVLRYCSVLKLSKKHDA